MIIDVESGENLSVGIDECKLGHSSGGH